MLRAPRVYSRVYRQNRNEAGFTRRITQREKVFFPRGKIYPMLRLKYYYTAHVHETRDVTYNWVSNLPLLILPYRKACSWNRSVDGNKSPTLRHHRRLPIILLSTYRMSQYWAQSIKHSWEGRGEVSSSFSPPPPTEIPMAIGCWLTLKDAIKLRHRDATWHGTWHWM